jgi:hypothetical protein
LSVAHTLRRGRDGSKQTRLGLGALGLAHRAPPASVARLGPGRGLGHHGRAVVGRRSRANQQRSAVPGEQNPSVAKQLGVRVVVRIIVAIVERVGIGRRSGGRGQRWWRSSSAGFGCHAAGAARHGRQ